MKNGSVWSSMLPDLHKSWILIHEFVSAGLHWNFRRLFCWRNAEHFFHSTCRENREKRVWIRCNFWKIKYVISQTHSFEKNWVKENFIFLSTDYFSLFRTWALKRKHFTFLKLVIADNVIKIHYYLKNIRNNIPSISYKKKISNQIPFRRKIEAELFQTK